MKEQNRELIKEIRNRIQFLVTVEIFFSAFLYAFSVSTGSEEILAQTNTLFWGIGVGLCIGNYLMIGLLESVAEGILKWVRNTISINLAAFISLLILIATSIKGPLPKFYELVFNPSLWVAIWMPAVTFLLICFIMAWSQIKKPH